MTKLEKKETNGKFIKNEFNKTAKKFLMTYDNVDGSEKKYLSLNKTANIKINKTKIKQK